LRIDQKRVASLGTRYIVHVLAPAQGATLGSNAAQVQLKSSQSGTSGPLFLPSTDRAGVLKEPS
jgi:hypothetical protein